MKSILLWLFVINLGIAFCAGLYEARVGIPRWANLPPEDWPNTGLLFWVCVTTVPLTLLASANLIAAWFDKSVKRKWWLGAVFIVLIERIATFSYSYRPWSISPIRICLRQRPVQDYSNGLFRSWATSSYLGGVVDGAQSIVVTVNH